MTPDGPEEPTVKKSRSGLFCLLKTETVADEPVNGEYAMVINGHSLVRTRTLVGHWKHKTYILIDICCNHFL